MDVVLVPTTHSCTHIHASVMPMLILPHWLGALKMVCRVCMLDEWAARVGRLERLFGQSVGWCCCCGCHFERVLPRCSMTILTRSPGFIRKHGSSVMLVTLLVLPAMHCGTRCCCDQGEGGGVQGCEMGLGQGC